MAGPFEANEYLDVIPVDKKLDAAWVRSLFERGKPQTYSDPESLKHIGMPIGGLCTGTLYLGGDGKLWLWDVFNRDVEGILPRPITFQGQPIRTRNGGNYVSPAPPASPLDQGFAVQIRAAGQTIVRSLDAGGFSDITFRGEYPRARVTHTDPSLPVTVQLEAFSPFIPLNVEDSSLPATVMHYTIRNRSEEAVEVALGGWLENAVCVDTKSNVAGRRRNRIVRADGATSLLCTAEREHVVEPAQRPDVVFEDFERDTYAPWTVEGTAFGSGPLRMKDMPGYQGDVGGKGERVVNSHNVRQGEDVGGGDAHLGKLTSKPFTIERHYIRFLVGGGNHAGTTCVNLVLDDQVAASVTGKANNRMEWTALNVKQFEGKQARLEIVDQAKGGWGNIGVDQIVFTDRPLMSGELEDQHDFGTMTLTLLDGDEDAATGIASVRDAGVFGEPLDEATRPINERLMGGLRRNVRLGPQQQTTFVFLITWHFPNLRVRGLRADSQGRHYATRFASALDVARYVAGNFDRLAGETNRWCDTWYDSTLPYWFLDRTFANTSTLATSTCYRFEDGRFYAWEGIGCCPGTCTHVWHYAQAVARVFPELERDTRERVDFGIAFHQDGSIGYRGEFHQHHADDGQAGTILRAYREHQMSADDEFLPRNWPRIKQALQFMIDRDGNDDGIIEGAQPNTLDASWYGKISWLASLYLAALAAGEAMAGEVGDADFAARCRAIRARGADEILGLYNGEYFIQQPDPQHLDAIGVDSGCHIDQVLGQSWAWQVGLGRLISEPQMRSALESLWKYNFVPDIGPFRERFTQGRWYAVAGDAGLVMCTWPKGGKRDDWQKHWQYQYFNECMSGFEWQVAAHMIWEGMLTEGLAIARAIHDRYNAALRNPYNEIECSDHYARAMASYGAFLAACGYEYHGPKGHLGFAPRLSPDDFRAPFTAAEGWGTFSQQRASNKQTAVISVVWGKLRLRTLAFEAAEGATVERVQVKVAGQNQAADFTQSGRRVSITLQSEATIRTGESLQVELA
jgi:uncharacterized protein (DUF608 family)